MNVGMVLYLPTAPVQLPIKVAREIRPYSPRQILRIAGFTDEARLAFDNLFTERAHVCCDHGQAETIAEEQHPTLKDLVVRQHHNISRLQINLHLRVRNELGL